MKIKMKPTEKEGKRTFEQNLDEIMEKLDGLNVQKCMFPEEYDDIDSESDCSDYDMDLHDGEAEYDYVLSVISLVKKSIAYLKRTTTPLRIRTTTTLRIRTATLLRIRATPWTLQLPAPHLHHLLSTPLRPRLANDPCRLQRKRL
jgi:hypothetical protein